MYPYGMKATKAVLCPKCGALNRPTWEFCARCNESLEGATSVDESVGSAASDEDDAPASAAPANTIALAGVLAVVIVAAAGWRTISAAPDAAAPDPSVFTMGTQPPELPKPGPGTQPGGMDYDAGRRALHSGDLAAAVERLAAAAAADPTNAEYKNAYGHALWRSGDREGALAAQAEAARLDPRLQMQYARSLDVAGRTADAVAQYQQILARNPRPRPCSRTWAACSSAAATTGERRPTCRARSSRGPTTPCCSRSSPTPWARRATVREPQRCIGRSSRRPRGP